MMFATDPARAIFEFSLIYPDPKGTLRCMMFLGYGSAQKEGGDVNYRGSFRRPRSITVAVAVRTASNSSFRTQQWQFDFV